MKTAIQTAIEQANKIESEHPYKVEGNPNTYNEYNEGWSNAMDRIIDVLTDLLPTEKQQIETAYEVGAEDTGKGEFGGSPQYATAADYFTQTFKTE